MLEIAHALTIFADGLFLLPIASITLRTSDRVLALSGFSTSNLPGRSPKLTVITSMTSLHGWMTVASLPNRWAKSVKGHRLTGQAEIP